MKPTHYNTMCETCVDIANNSNLMDGVIKYHANWKCYEGCEFYKKLCCCGNKKIHFYKGKANDINFPVCKKYVEYPIKKESHVIMLSTCSEKIKPLNIDIINELLFPKLRSVPQKNIKSSGRNAPRKNSGTTDQNNSQDVSHDLSNDESCDGSNKSSNESLDDSSNKSSNKSLDESLDENSEEPQKPSPYFIDNIYYELPLIMSKISCSYSNNKLIHGVFGDGFDNDLGEDYFSTTLPDYNCEGLVFNCEELHLEHENPNFDCNKLTLGLGLKLNRNVPPPQNSHEPTKNKWTSTRTNMSINDKLNKKSH